MDLGSIIQFYRTKQGLTQKDLANGVCSVSYLSKIESGALVPKSDTIELLFNRLNMDYEKLTSYDEQTIQRQIDQLYKQITFDYLEQAKEIVDELNDIITPFHEIHTQNYFELMHFYYLIKTNPTEKFKVNFQDLLRLETEFTERKLFYFYKIVGFYYNCHLNAKQANHYFHLAKDILEDHNLRDPEIYYLLALSYMGMNKPIYSNYYVGIALEQYANDLLYRKVTDCYHLFGINYLNLEAYDISKSYFNQVLKSKPMGDSPKVRSRATHNLAILYYRQGDLDYALELLFEALNNHDYLYDTAHTTLIIAKVFIEQGKHDKAQEYVTKGEELLQGTNFTKVRHRFYILKHQLQKRTHEQDFIDRCVNVILPHYKTIGENGLMKELLQLLAEVYTEKEEYLKAIDYYKQLNELKI
ncbi:helix-turn-helix transcriptional regulator [Aquisalibacillus elongatus]|uniref:Transcriptional regulator with XRE-family HTH domain n=1 Tax=Aquisalibacillus elongatus TaxID=485577 RepID=A0A3N5BHJ3_9BACI|nr:helix-turn-helix transcriptional regulator [Aquisalibacillus elongatus]RPF57053.1 transcriptional regulator with XRE-family HTH domain [Aquisalibacillus elongatus]